MVTKHWDMARTYDSTKDGVVYEAISTGEQPPVSFRLPQYDFKEMGEPPTFRLIVEVEHSEAEEEPK